MSPRRSSRARTTQPPSGTAPSVTSSSGSSRADRARANGKQASPQKSSTPHSLSSEEPEDAPLDSQIEPPVTRRRTREQDHGDDDAAKDDDLEDDMAEEDEVTRCVCGYMEYPGLPSDAAKTGLADVEAQGDDLSGLFIQCDICKVWQHGGCVGIMQEEASPDEYFCDECRKDLHKVMTSPKGQKYSRYLPVYDQQHGKARKSSLSKDPEKTPGRDKDRHSRASVDSFGKRRSTMNSRAAYDEDEVLRKVIEESKHEGPQTSENGNRKKRSREDSEEMKPEIKRQRTGSRSPSGSPVLESEDDSTRTPAPKQKPRGAAARSQQQKEQREKDRDKERAEAANRRKGRAERRKGDENEALESTPTPTLNEEAVAPAVVPDSAPPEPSMSEPKPPPAPRRGGRPPQKARGRLGRNQYSRDTVPSTNGASPADTPASPQPSATTNGLGNGHDSSDGTAGGGKPAKSKNWRLQKLSWNDIRRPAGAMQNYIAQRQVEMAGEKAPAVQHPLGLANGTLTEEEAKDDGGGDLDKFKHLSTTQMMDDLSRDLVHWQRMISQPSEK
ncbi:Histone deacetylase complex subunit [Pleosporales sp. CAS-2024a]